MGTNLSMERSLSSLQHRVARRLNGRQLRRRGSGSWEYPSLEEALVETIFEGIGKYITRRQNMVAQYIATQLITRSLLSNYTRDRSEERSSIIREELHS